MATFNAQMFRDAAAVTQLLKGGFVVEDVTPVRQVAEYLDSCGKSIDEFLTNTAVQDQALLWIGAQAVTRRRCRTDSLLFGVVREMTGLLYKIRFANGQLERAHTFLDQIGKTCY
jgi:hypothetical protein